MRNAIKSKQQKQTFLRNNNQLENLMIQSQQGIEKQSYIPFPAYEIDFITFL